MSEFTNEHLKYLQSMPLDIKIGLTTNRIREWLREYDAYVSFSGGKDSTVLLHIARKLRPSIKAVYIDTGLEYPEVRDFVTTIENIERLYPPGME
jgi:3'-phosphoadenosine 5'-phosphosulfate sulfotransferase (PAPS reductase)/FAD synthetase